MARAKLSDAERESRRKARSAFTFSDQAYRHYVPKNEGYGSESEWIHMADEILNGKGILRETVSKPTSQLERDLATLFIDALPFTAADLKRCWRNAMMCAHPDRGGSHEAAIETMEAFKRLAKFY